MKTYDEIRDLMVNRLGLTDLKAYEAWGQKLLWNGTGPMRTPRAPTREDIELLSPDDIDNNAFWRIAEELFSTDPVSNCNYARPFSVEEANRNNLRLYHYDGFTGMAEACKSAWGPTRAPMLEIGPGYGAFKQWVAGLDYYDYFATDVYPRIPGVEPTELNGLLSDVTRGRKYALVMASNVFQHLSLKQRRAYYSDIAATLLPGGVFMVSMMVDDGSLDPGHRDAESGYWWCRHYGQLTPIQRAQDIFRDLQAHFRILAHTIRNNGNWIAVTCEKRA